MIAKHVDVISPMLYPNHFGPGELGVDNPNGNPNAIVALSMGTFRSQLINSPNVKIRPWLQDFGGYGAASGEGADHRGNAPGRDRMDALERRRGLQLGRVRQGARRLDLRLRLFAQAPAKLPAWQ